MKLSVIFKILPKDIVATALAKLRVEKGKNIFMII